MQHNPCIWHFGSVSSCLDVARQMVASKKMSEWDSVLASSQYAGRGQMRRNWISPKGNVYAALRLPTSSPFLTCAAAPAVGGLFAIAFERMGLDVRIKWPNDIVLQCGDKAKKVAGILIEEREGILVAGIGVNLFSSPPSELLRPDAALEATSIRESSPNFLSRYNSSDLFWRSLVKYAYSVYNENAYPEYWRSATENCLLWHRQNVLLRDGDQLFSGVLEGLSPSGELVLFKDGVQHICHSGSLELADQKKWEKS